MKLGALREALGRFGYELNDLDKTLEVLQDGVMVESVLKKGANGFEDYNPQCIAELRKRLGLVAEEGIDSACFYGQKGLAEELNMFIQLRLDVMKRLAKI